MANEQSATAEGYVPRLSVRSGDEPWRRVPARRVKPSYEDLEEEIVYLRGEMGLSHDETRYFTLRKTFGISPNTCKLVMFMFRAKGRVVSNAQIMECIGSEADSPTVPRVYIWQIRKAMGATVVESSWSGGYCMTEAGIRMVEKALAA